MKKSNPLFVDTTKFNGDSLFTQVELNGIPPYVGELVTVKVTDKNGVDQTVELERKNESQCVGQVFLTYRQEITYSFAVSRNGEPIFEMGPKATIASYLIQETWFPISLHRDLDFDVPAEVPEQINVAEQTALAEQVDESEPVNESESVQESEQTLEQDSSSQEIQAVEQIEASIPTIEDFNLESAENSNIQIHAQDALELESDLI